MRDLQSVGQILRGVLIGKNPVPANVEWLEFYTIAMKETSFDSYRESLPRVLSEYWPKSSGDYLTTSQNDRLHGITYLASQRQRNTFEW